jgi:Zn-dependent protease
MEVLSVFSIGVFLIILFVSIAVHETMHALVAYKLGDDLAHSRGRISLNPIRHIDPVLTVLLPGVMLMLGQSPILAARPVPINPNRVSGSELGLTAIGLAGPLTNLVLAAVCAISIRTLDPQGMTADIMLLFVELNVGLFTFNMLPVPPLDGSRLLYAVAPASVQLIMDKIEAFGMLTLLLMLFLLSPFIGPILGNINESILVFLFQ